jgi:CBS domain-containing protein
MPGGATMTVKAMLERKGRDVEVITPGHTVADAAKTLAEKKIGAIVVTTGDGVIKGIVSERDVVRLIAASGAQALDMAVDSAMTRKVIVCQETSTVNEVMEIMTRGRFRHLPVEADGKLAGIISIGDVVKRKIEDVEREAEEIRNYIATG